MYSGTRFKDVVIRTSCRSSAHKRRPMRRPARTNKGTWGEMTASAQPAVKAIKLSRTCAWAAALVAADAFVLNQGMLSALVGLWMLAVSLPRAVFGKPPEQRGPRLARVAIMLGAVALVFGLNWANNQIARHRADTLVAAVKAFKQAHQRYPAKLDELVPEFIDHVSPAKYVVMFSAFYYLAAPDSHSLFYVEFPPFGRPIYDFEKAKWWYLD